MTYVHIMSISIQVTQYFDEYIRTNVNISDDFVL